MTSLVCDHSDDAEYETSSLVTMFPNFILNDNVHEYSHESLHSGLYIYVGGDIVIERGLIDKFSAELIHGGLSIHAVVNNLNQEAFNN